jgi:hypothetical protein
MRMGQKTGTSKTSKSVRAMPMRRERVEAHLGVQGGGVECMVVGWGSSGRTEAQAAAGEQMLLWAGKQPALSPGCACPRRSTMLVYGLCWL